MGNMNQQKNGRKKKKERGVRLHVLQWEKKKKRGFTWNLKFSIVVSYIIIIVFPLLSSSPLSFQIHPSSTFALHTMKKMNNILLCNERSNDLFLSFLSFSSTI